MLGLCRAHVGGYVGLMLALWWAMLGLCWALLGHVKPILGPLKDVEKHRILEQ